MNIIEAIKSGKRLVLRETGYGSYPGRVYMDDHGRLVHHRTDMVSVLNMNLILSDNWEIEEEKVEVTKEQLRNAILSGYNNGLCPSQYRVSEVESITDFQWELLKNDK